MPVKRLVQGEFQQFNYERRLGSADMLGHGFDSRRLHLDEDETLRNADMKRFIRHSVGCFLFTNELDDVSTIMKRLTTMHGLYFKLII